MLTGRKFVSIVKPKRLLTQMNRPNRKGFILIPFQFQIGIIGPKDIYICMEVHYTISLKLARSLPLYYGSRSSALIIEIIVNILNFLL